MEELETGTRQFPYKSIVPAFKEVLNEHRGTSLHISVFVMEGTTTRYSDKIVTLEVAHLTLRLALLHINRDSTYSDIEGKQPERATLINTGTEQAEQHWSPRYSVMSGVDWDTQNLIGIGEISLYEAFTSVMIEKFVWSVVRTPITVSGFNILSKTLAF